MNNMIQDGDRMTVAAPYALTAGQGALVGAALFGVACNTAASGGTVELEMTGVVRLTALGTDTFTVGALVYWDNTNRRCTSTASGNRIIGQAAAAKASGATTVDVRIDGVAR